jgi:hypothetical protein
MQFWRLSIHSQRFSSQTSAFFCDGCGEVERIEALGLGERASRMRRSTFKLNQALVQNVKTLPAMRREKAQAAPSARLKVPMRWRGADCFVVTTKQCILVER